MCVWVRGDKKMTFGLKLFPGAKSLGIGFLPLLRLEEVQHLQRWMSGEVLLDLPAPHVRLSSRIRVVRFTEKKVVLATCLGKSSSQNCRSVG